MLFVFSLACHRSENLFTYSNFAMFFFFFLHSSSELVYSENSAIMCILLLACEWTGLDINLGASKFICISLIYLQRVKLTSERKKNKLSIADVT